MTAHGQQKVLGARELQKFKLAIKFQDREGGWDHDTAWVSSSRPAWWPNEAARTFWLIDCEGFGSKLRNYCRDAFPSAAVD
jgi:hypothetical protein